MAYDPLNPKDEEGGESQYASLLTAAPAAPAVAPVTGGAPAPATPAVHKTAQPGFVNFDRVMSANKSTVDRMKNDFASTEQRQAQALRTGAQAIEKDVTGKAVAVAAAPAAPSVAPGDTFVTGPNPFGASVTPEDIKKSAAATYAGPSRADVESRYAPLLASYKAYQNSQVAPTGLDATLMGPMDTRARAGVEGEFNASLNKATGAVDAASKASGENASKWGALLGQQEAQAKNSEVVAGEAEATRQNDVKSDQAFGSVAIPQMARFLGPDVAKRMQEAASSFTPDERRELTRIAANGDYPRFSVTFDKFYRARGGNSMQLAHPELGLGPARKP